jgi:hypothetical protein
MDGVTLRNLAARCAGGASVMSAARACAAAVLLVPSVAALPPTPACTGLEENPHPFYTGPLREVARSADGNGIRYETGVPGPDGCLLHVVKTKGTPFEQGLAMGELFRAEMPQMMNLTLAMVDAYLDEACGERFHPLCEVIEKGAAVQDALKAFNLFVHRYTPQ